MCYHRAHHKSRHHTAWKYKRHWGQHSMKHFWKEKMKAYQNYPPVNVQELDDQYLLFLYAPGREKSDFQISTIDHTLRIAVAEKEQDPTVDWRRQEYVPGGFEREFALNEKVNTEAISARYEQGVLIVTLPKLEGTERIRRDIGLV